tara:strand:+ start:117 stop:284 length:168 start_codon:yes stop_codon:yes gene_type:complete
MSSTTASITSIFIFVALMIFIGKFDEKKGTSFLWPYLCFGLVVFGFFYALLTGNL